MRDIHLAAFFFYFLYKLRRVNQPRVFPNKSFRTNDCLTEDVPSRVNAGRGMSEGFSRGDNAINVVNINLGAWEDSQDAIGVFCDLSKAFDCVHHDTLNRKLHHYGVTGRCLRLLESYLSDRIQRVDINGERSSGSAVNMGVPQGSVLGPSLFLVYINHLPHLVKNGHGIVICADDTSLLFKIDSCRNHVDLAESVISKQLSNLITYGILRRLYQLRRTLCNILNESCNRYEETDADNISGNRRRATSYGRPNSTGSRRELLHTYPISVN
ncbi:RNA-directed DNA polymerase from mobile element jockey [Eumeta japonica]|uniref:RNA-directed DNA polymerase from mobile element jockey n=1 Tax=Eumeta variegata TaxID=151549 RepID=A0A4C1XTN9_EUMVA|nr:RNA-directed DNA polymerase from mobile element jockey [Eumeta japonica]